MRQAMGTAPNRGTTPDAAADTPGVDAPDAALVRAALDGDRAAYAVIVERHRPMVAALCRRMTGDVALAEDAVQEAVLAGLVDLERLRRPDRIGPWLAGIALNVCRRELRRRARLAPFDGDDDGTTAGGAAPHGSAARVGPVAGAAVDPAAAAEVAETVEAVRRAVAMLPPGQRRAVAGFYLQGLTHAELAAALDIRVGAVKARLHKARAVLRRRLADTRDDPGDPRAEDPDARAGPREDPVADGPPGPRAAHDRAAHDRAAHDRAAHDRAAHDRVERIRTERSRRTR